MDELPISLISNDLKYTLSSLKIKTLEKARQYYYNQNIPIEVVDDVQDGQPQPIPPVVEQSTIGDRLEKIKKYLAKYDAVKDQVLSKISILPQHQTQKQKVVEFYGGKDLNGMTQSIDWSKIFSQGNNNSRKVEPVANNGFKIQRTESKLQMANFSIDSKDRQMDLQRSQVDITQSLQNSTRQKQQWPITQSINRQEDNSNVMIPEKNNDLADQSLYERSLTDSSIVEVCGGKGVGKTAMLLHLCERHAQKSNKRLYFINCAGGITYKRFERLSTSCPNMEYRDSYILEHVLAVCKTALNDPETGCIAIDSLTNLLMQEEKTLIFLIKMFKIFSTLEVRGCKIFLTNYIQQWFDTTGQNEDIMTNQYSYFSSVTSEFIKWKYFIRKEKGVTRTDVKMVRGGFVDAIMELDQDGVGNVKVMREQN